jgi:CBS domain-containing protein
MRLQIDTIMSAPLVCVADDTPVKEVARLLAERHFGGVPVVRDGSVVGVVAASDIVRVEQTSELRPERRLRRRHRPEAPPRTAGDAMSSPALSVDVHTSAVGAARLMTANDVSRLVVTDRGESVGIVTRRDLVRAFGRSDAAVRHEIVSDVLPSLDVSPNDVLVSVRDGEVALRGQVESAFQANHLANAVCTVVGVIAVDCDVAARHTPT